MSDAMTTYNEMRMALQACLHLDEAVEIRNKAMGLEEYARCAKDKEPLQWVNEIRMRAERRVGELLREMAKTGARELGQGGNRRSRSLQGIVKPTLAQFGISGNQSSRWQMLASVSPAKFESAIAKLKAIDKSLSTSSVMRELGMESDLKSRGKYAKPMTGPKAKAIHEALDAAAVANASMVAMYARLLLRELRAHTEFNQEEQAILDELASVLQQREVLP
jgi:hypothetical protein